MKKRTKFLFNLLGLSLSVIPPLVAALAYFPLWQKEGGGATVSGLLMLLLIASLLPLLRVLRGAFKCPSAYVIWLILLFTFLLMSKIADQCVVISFFGFAGNLLGAVFFNLAKRRSGEDA